MNTIRSALIIAVAMALQACVTTSQELPRPAARGDAAEANLNLGAAYLRQGNPELALDKLDRALEQNPRLAAAHSTIAVAYDQLGDEESAERHYRRATQLEPNNSDAHNNYAVFLCRRDRWEEARPHFDQAVSNLRYPTPAVALTNAGVCAEGVGDLEAAETYLRRALDRTPEFPDALGAMMELQFRRQNYLAARAFMQRAFDVQRPTARQLSLCVRIEQALDNGSAADECMQRLREEFPRSAELAQLREQGANVER